MSGRTIARLRIITEADPNGEHQAGLNREYGCRQVLDAEGGHAHASYTVATMDARSAQAICDLFRLGTLRGSFEAVGGGLTNRLWRCTTERGVFAVKEMSRDPNRTDYVAWFDRAFVLEQAAFATGMPMPRPIPVAATGRCLGALTDTDDKHMTVRVHEWVEGKALQNNTIYPGDVAAPVAEMLARIHNLGMPSDTPVVEAVRVFGDEYWRALAGRMAVVDGDLAAILHELLPALRDLEAYLRVAHNDATPLLVSHRDADMKNILRTSAGELMLVDWDAAGPVNPRHDLANTALVWAGVHLGDPLRASARAVVDAYRRSGGSTAPFRETDLAELVAVRLGWFEFNIHRALGERVRDASDREVGANVIRRNREQLPRFARSLDAWLAVLAD